MQINLAAFIAGFFDRASELGHVIASAADAGAQIVTTLEATIERPLSHSERVFAELTAALEFNRRKAAAAQLNPWTTSTGDYCASEADARQRQRWANERTQRNAIRFSSALSRASELQS